MKTLLGVIMFATTLVAQSSGNANHSSNVRLADKFPGSDIGGKINAAVADLPTVSGKAFGIVSVPTGSYSYSLPIVMNSPFVQLQFNNAYLTYTGPATTPAISCSDAPTSYGGTGGIYNLMLSSSRNGVVGIQNTECTWFQIHDVDIELTGTDTVGIRFQNTRKWTEQSNLDNVHVYANTPFDWQDNCAKHAGCSSFAYERFRQVVASPHAGGTGYSLENDSNLGGGDLDLQCFGNELGPITCLRMSGTSMADGVRIKIGGEGPQGPSNIGISTIVGTQFSPNSLTVRWNEGTWHDSILGTYIPYISNIVGTGPIYANRNGLRVGNASTGFDATLDSTLLTAFRTFKFPDATGTAALKDADNKFLHLQTFVSGIKAGASGSTVSDTRELIQSAHACGSTDTCSNSGNQAAREIYGAITLSSGAATLRGINPSFTRKSSFICICTDQTSAEPCSARPTSGSSVAFAGKGADTLAYHCTGN